MNTNDPNWPIVERIAREHGVKDEALRKWGERGKVPGDWALRIIAASKGALKANDFSQVKNTPEAA